MNLDSRYNIFEDFKGLGGTKITRMVVLDVQSSLIAITSVKF
jgi:hypothetical protein